MQVITLHCVLYEERNRMEVILILASVIQLVIGLKCRTALDPGIRWIVDCSAMNLSHTPPPMIINPVLILNLSHNIFVNLSESQFINWTDISHLDLSSNTIENIENNSFKGLSNLTELNLMNNFIKILSSNITNHLTKLRILNLSSNKLQIIRSGTFRPIPLLLKLYLKHNLNLGETLDNYISLDISFTQGLITLDVMNISLKDVPVNFFNNATHLIALNIAQNPLKNIPDLPPSLRHLNISGTLIETLPQGLFLKSDLLQRLSIENMAILKAIQPNSLNGLNNLEELYIKYCPELSYFSADAFGESCPTFKNLSISHCGLTTLPKNLKQLVRKVEYLDLQENPWICDGHIYWIVSTNILPNLTQNLRCDSPPNARGKLLVDYFKPRTLHPHTSLIRAGIVVAMVIVLVASVVGMIRHMKKQKPKSYRQLQDIRLQDRTPNALPPL